MFRITVFWLCAFLFSGYTPEVPDDAGEPVETVCVEGLILDHDTSEPLPGAKITVHGHKEAFYADLEGRFRISGISPGVYSIMASYVSYQSEEISKITLTAPVSDLLITLKP